MTRRTFPHNPSMWRESYYTTAEKTKQNCVFAFVLYRLWLQQELLKVGGGGGGRALALLMCRRSLFATIASQNRVMILRPIARKWMEGTALSHISPQAFDLTTMWYCADWWNARRFEFGSSFQMNIIFPVWLQLIRLATNECAPLVNWKGLFGIHQSFALSLFFTWLFTTVLSQWDFLHGKFGLPSPGKASCDRVALPNLRRMLGVLEFPWSTDSTELWQGIRDL